VIRRKHGGEVTAESAKGADPFRRAKGSGDLLLHLDHAQVALGQVVGERNGQVIQKPEHLLGALQEGIQQVQGGILFLVSPSFRWGGSGWLAWAA
jgi:hypothetical protein